MLNSKIKDVLRNSKGRWILTDIYNPHYNGSSIRIVEENDQSRHFYCPLTYACKRLTGLTFDIDDYIEAGDHLGLSEEEINTIADCADSPTSSEWYDPEIRKEMLEILGLSEKETEDA